MGPTSHRRHQRMTLAWPRWPAMSPPTMTLRAESCRAKATGRGPGCVSPPAVRLEQTAPGLVTPVMPAHSPPARCGGRQAARPRPAGTTRHLAPPTPGSDPHQQTLSQTKTRSRDGSAWVPLCRAAPEPARIRHKPAPARRGQYRRDQRRSPPLAPASPHRSAWHRSARGDLQAGAVSRRRGFPGLTESSGTRTAWVVL